MSLIYGVIAIISLCMVGVCVAIDKKQDVWLLMLFVSVSLCNLGYFMQSVSVNLEVALNANRIIYLGSVYLLFFMFMMVQRFCQMKKNKYLTAFLLIIGFIMLGITTSPGILPIYYSSVDFKIVNHTAMLVREYGPLHSLYYVYLFGYMFAMIGITLYAIIKKRISSKSHIILLLCAVFCNLLIWVIEQFLPRGFEWLSISYVLTEVFILIIYQSLQQQGLIPLNKSVKSYTINVLITVYLLIFANFVRLITMEANVLINLLSHMVVLLIYIGILIYWGLSVCERILNPKIRRYMVYLVFLMIMWMFMRTLRFTVFYHVYPFGQWCWYAYYIPMIMIPQICLFASKYIGKADDYKLSSKWYLMCIPPIILVVGILTNDLHEFAFQFYAGYENGWDVYHRGILYYAAVFWVLICIIQMMIEILRNCRVPGTKKMIWLPVAMFALGVLYSTLYAVNTSLFGFVEMTAALCFIVVAIWESSIKTGLIPSNTYYDELLRYSGAGVSIANYDDEIQYYSKDALPLTKEQIRAIKKQPLLLNSGLRVSRFNIRGGYALWQEDLTALLDILSELQLIYEELKDEVSLEMQNYQAEKKLYTLIERNRLHDKMNQDTLEQIKELNTYLDCFIKMEDIEQRKTLLKQVVIVGSYLKRRNNLFLLSEQQDEMHEMELSLSINEVLKNLTISGVQCGCMSELNLKIDCNIAMTLFEYFYTMISKIQSVSESILVRLFYRNQNYFLCMDVMSETNLLEYQIPNVVIHEIENHYYTLVYQL